MVTESELLDRAKAGDGDAFRLLVAPHRQMVMSLCRRITGSSYDAEDAVQDALLAAWRHLGSFHGSAKFSTWLFRIAYNAALAIARSRVPAPVGDGPIDLVGSPAESNRVVTVQSVRWALARIPPDFRAALVLREYFDLSYEEIASFEGIKVATVKTRINRARKALALLLIDD